MKFEDTYAFKALEIQYAEGPHRMMDFITQNHQTTIRTEYFFSDESSIYWKDNFHHAEWIDPETRKAHHIKVMSNLTIEEFRSRKTRKDIRLTALENINSRTIATTVCDYIYQGKTPLSGKNTPRLGAILDYDQNTESRAVYDLVYKAMQQHRPQQDFTERLNREIWVIAKSVTEQMPEDLKQRIYERINT